MRPPQRADTGYGSGVSAEGVGSGRASGSFGRRHVEHDREAHGDDQGQDQSGGEASGAEARRLLVVVVHGVTPSLKLKSDSALSGGLKSGRLTVKDTAKCHFPTFEARIGPWREEEPFLAKLGRPQSNGKSQAIRLGQVFQGNPR